MHYSDSGFGSHFELELFTKNEAEEKGNENWYAR